MMTCSIFIGHHIYHHLHQLMNYCIEDAYGILGTSKITFMLKQGSLVKVSVIVATRNRAHAIGPCLDSIATASLKLHPSMPRSWLSITGPATIRPRASRHGLPLPEYLCSYSRSQRPDTHAHRIMHFASRTASCWPSPTTIAGYILNTLRISCVTTTKIEDSSCVADG